MHADAKLALQDLLHALPALLPELDAAWLPGLRATRAAYDERLAAMAGERAAPMHPAALAQAVGQAMSLEALAVCDGGHTSF